LARELNIQAPKPATTIDGRLAVVELGKAYLGIGVDEGLLVGASNAFQVADLGCPAVLSIE